MSKVVKIKQSDIENIVENIITDQIDQENSIAKEETTEDVDNQGTEQYMVAKSEDGKFAVINVKTGEVLGMK
jgi:phage regulator Rha-like protein